MSDELQPISVVAPKVGMSPSNLRRLALDGVIPAQRDKTGKYLVMLNDVLAHCATGNRAGASKAPTEQLTTKLAGIDAGELAALRMLLAAKDAEIERLLTDVSRERDRVERLEEKIERSEERNIQTMSLYQKLLAETQALLAGATGTFPSAWVHTGSPQPHDQPRSEKRGFKNPFRREP